LFCNISDPLLHGPPVGCPPVSGSSGPSMM
jgi:hypothetical protein